MGIKVEGNYIRKSDIEKIVLGESDKVYDATQPDSMKSKDVKCKEENLEECLRKLIEKQEIKLLKDSYEQHKDKIDNAHKRDKLKFKLLSIADFNSKPALKLYKSPTYNRKQSSEYRLLFIDGEAAYARKSNHWGTFEVNVYENDPDAKTLFPNANPDQYGRLGWKKLEWRLEGGQEKSSKSQAGFILLKDLIT